MTSTCKQFPLTNKLKKKNTRIPKELAMSLY